MSETDKESENTLKNLTETFWTKHSMVAQEHGRSSPEIDSVWQTYYIQGPLEHEGKTYPPLLKMEIDCAQKQGHVTINEPQTPLTLVILVGLTFEPLLQSIAVHRPQTLIPILNHTYGDDPDDEDHHVKWDDHWESLAYYIDTLKDTLQFELNVTEPQEPVGDSAQEVFTYLTNNDTLRSALTNPKMRVVIDITGAKKTMVAGAFLLGMQSKAEIWYIDTGKYKEGRPYGYSCHFRRVDQPLHDLKMEAWRRVEKAYEQYDFLWAKYLIPDEYVGQLPTFFEMLHHWDNGHLRQAKCYYHKLSRKETQILAPSSILELAQFWPKIQFNQAALNKRFFANPAHVLLYAKEEMARIQRLIGFGERADYRAAYMRAFALHETLLKARLIDLENPQTQDEWDQLLHKVGENEARERLASRRFKQRVNGCIFEVPTNYAILKETRNRVAHTYYPLNDQLTLDVVSLAETNLHNYEELWANVSETNKRTDKPEWQAVKTAFNLAILDIAENQ